MNACSAHIKGWKLHDKMREKQKKEPFVEFSTCASLTFVYNNKVYMDGIFNHISMYKTSILGGMEL